MKTRIPGDRDLASGPISESMMALAKRSTRINELPGPPTLVPRRPGRASHLQKGCLQHEVPLVGRLPYLDNLSRATPRRWYSKNCDCYRRGEWYNTFLN